MNAPTEPFRRNQFALLGLSEYVVQRMVQAGEVRRVFRGVYCPTSIPDDTETRARCARLVLPDHAVVCDRSAAVIHGVEILDPTERGTTPPLEIVSLRGRNVSQLTGVYAGSRELLPEDITTIHGVPVTTPLRTALDLACLRGPHKALATLDAFMRQHDLTQADYARLLRRFRRRRGVVQVRRLVPWASPDSESPGESFTRYLILEEGLDAPEPQVWVRNVPGFGWCRLDLAYRHLRIAVEYDGREAHGPEQAAHDQARRAALRDLGWIVIVVQSMDLSHQGSRWWITELREALAERAQPHRRRYPRGQPWLHT